MPDLDAWKATWTGLGAAAGDARLYETLRARYAEPQRHYHTMQHLDECFARLAESRTDAERPYEVELALWFHDAVYDVRRHDNEEQSAAWAATGARDAGLPTAVADRVHVLIMATRHDRMPDTPDARLLVDIDLSILASPVDRFDEYERQVREEYSWVPDALFRSRRREILAGFLARPHIFGTARFQAVAEPRARANLARSIAALGDAS